MFYGIVIQSLQCGQALYGAADDRWWPTFGGSLFLYQALTGLWIPPAANL